MTDEEYKFAENDWEWELATCISYIRRTAAAFTKFGRYGILTKVFAMILSTKVTNTYEYAADFRRYVDTHGEEVLVQN